MHTWGLFALATSGSQLVATCGAAATIGGALVGLIFKNAAAAWRQERDAAVDKADRLEKKVDDQAAQIEALKVQVIQLERRTDYEAHAKQNQREHREIIDHLHELTRGLNANTTAVEFLLKQAFPTVTIPAPTT